MQRLLILLLCGAAALLVACCGSQHRRGVVAAHGPLVAHLVTRGEAERFSRSSGNIHKSRHAIEEREREVREARERRELEEREREAIEVPTEAITCNKYVSTGGNDNNAGTEGAPWKTVKHGLLTATAGQVVCLAAGQTFNEEISLQSGATHGSAGNPVVVSSINTTNPATINGRIVLHKTNDYLTFQWLKLVCHSEGVPCWTLDANHSTWRYVDATSPTTICFNMSTFESTPEANAVEYSRVHNCGSEQTTACDEDTPPCNVAPNSGYFVHGVYDDGVKTVVKNNYIYENAGRGIQLRIDKEAVVEHNVIDKNQSCVVVAEGSTKDKLAKNVCTNSKSVCGESKPCNDYGYWTFFTSTPNAEDTSTEDDSFNNQLENFHWTCATGCTVTSAHEENPSYVNAATHNYKIGNATLKALGAGPVLANGAAAPVAF